MARSGFRFRVNRQARDVPTSRYVGMIGISKPASADSASRDDVSDIAGDNRRAKRDRGSDNDRIDRVCRR
jgi:hypothetical protein